MLNALTPGAAPLERVADCDDTAAMASALASPASSAVNIGAAGTAMRFLTAYYACLPGRSVTLDGSPRMRRRPIGQLVDALRSLGAGISYLGEEGFPPLHIEGRRLAGGEVTLTSAVSSQYISALLMAGPLMTDGLTLKIEGGIPSMPYVKMTMEMMDRMGAVAVMTADGIKVYPGTYTAPAEEIAEQDWSAASYWYEIAALSSGSVTLPGLSMPSLQGDSAIAWMMERLGVVTSEADGGGVELEPSPEMHSRLELDLSDQPDLAQTLAVTSAMLGVPFRLTGLKSLRIKETDRLEALRRELDKLGVVAEVERDDTLAWEGERHPVWEIPAIDTYDDHRMAMAFAPVALYCPGLVVRDIDVVAKSYPGFWDDLRAAGFTLADASQPLETEEEQQ
jgi:3-phosphoshikimate 1-carboxyvinyltransferase